MSIGKSLGAVCGNYDLERCLVDEILQDLQNLNRLDSDKVEEINAQLFAKDPRKVKYYELVNVLLKYVNVDNI